MATESIERGHQAPAAVTSNRGRERLKQLAAIFALVLAIRLGAIAVIHLFGFNPFGEGQARYHARVAEEIASAGLAFDFDWRQNHHRWGLLLSPFWLLPGPSEIYAQVWVSILGSLGILNVYLICEYYHSKQAGLFAVVPLGLLPTYSFMHAVTQREALILLGVTTAFVLVFLPNRYVHPPWNYLLAIGCVSLAGYQRTFNIPVILFIIIFTVGIVFLTSDGYTMRTKISNLIATFSIGSLAVLTAITRFITDLGEVFDWLANLRERRTRGRATYLEGVIPETPVEFIVFSWVGAIYFLFAPFPWHIEAVSDLAGFVESTVGIVFLLFSVRGFRVINRHTPLAAITLAVALIIYSVLYGFGTGNYGTALRHRQTVFWILLIFGAIGISSKVRFKV